MCGLCKALEICLSPSDFRHKQDEPTEGRREECEKTKENWEIQLADRRTKSNNNKLLIACKHEFSNEKLKTKINERDTRLVIINRRLHGEKCTVLWQIKYEFNFFDNFFELIEIHSIYKYVMIIDQYTSHYLLFRVIIFSQLMLVVRARVVVVFCGREIRDSEPNERRRTLVGELSQCAT